MMQNMVVYNIQVAETTNNKEKERRAHKRYIASIHIILVKLHVQKNKQTGNKENRTFMMVKRGPKTGNLANWS